MVFNRFVVFVSLSLMLSYNALSDYYEKPCKDPFLLHDIYYGSNSEAKDLSAVGRYQLGIMAYPCVPSDHIRENYENKQKMVELIGFDIYPNTVKASYEKIKQFLSYTQKEGRYEEIKIAERLLNHLLWLTKTKNIEELKYLVETQGDKLLQPDVYYFYKFPKDYFEKNDSHTVFTIDGDFYEKYVEEFKKKHNFSADYFFREDKRYYFDYSVFLSCLGSDRLSECMEHNFIFIAYLLSLLSENDNLITLAEHEIAARHSDEGDSNHAPLKNNIMALKKELLPSYTKDDFSIYLRRGSKNGISEYVMNSEYNPAKDDQQNLRFKMEQIALFGETEDNELTRQDKLLYIYFDHFARARPDYIKKNEYAKISRFYYGKEDIYKSLYDLMEGQQTLEKESPVFYSVLYNILLTKTYETSMTTYAQEETEVKVGEKHYTKESLAKICQLYHDSLDKALQEATEERRKAFEAKNIQVCEI